MDRSGATPQALPLPGGGGATRGLGDAFTPDFNRGTGSFSVQIDVPAGPRDIRPGLALTYNSADGDGPFGLGWSLPLPQIRVDTDAGVPDWTAPRYLFAGERLVDLGGGRYAPEVENAFSRIRRDGDGFEVTDRGGTVTRLGVTPDARLSGTAAGAERVAAWLPETVRDTCGNEIRFTYRRDGGALYLDRVAWAAFEVTFAYEPRPDPPVNRRFGFAVTAGLRCTAIEVRRPDSQPAVARRYELGYLDAPDTPSLLASVRLRGRKRQPDGTVAELAAPPLALSYSGFQPGIRRLLRVSSAPGAAPGPLGRGGTELVDLDADGLPDVVQLTDAGALFWRNRGEGRLDPPRRLPERVLTGSLQDASAVFADLDGDGAADFALLSARRARYHPNRGDGTFGPARWLGRGRAPLDVAMDDPDTRFADLDGDGRVDLIRSTAGALVLWRNRGGEAGFAEPAVIPRHRDRDTFPDVQLSEPGVAIADMTGDGLPDLVHVVDGLVEYWPSLGPGRYDRRVVMRAAPRLPRGYDPKRVFLADVDGTGTADVVYAGSGTVLVWRNVGGARFAPAVEVAGVPATDRDDVRLVDFLGLGTAGILWSSVRSGAREGYRFLSFGDRRPWLLERADDGRGLVTEITYGASTAHAARDAGQGRPWATRLPMPVQVVNRVVRRDQASGAEQVVEVSYHDGRWDPRARRFRGFGRVTATRGAAGEQSREEHRYLVGAPGEPGLGTAAGELEPARRGQEFEVTYLSAGPGSPPVRIETTCWTVRVAGTGADGTRVLAPQVAGTRVENRECGDHPRVTAASYRYDDVGNVVEEHRAGSGPAGDDAGAPVPPLEVVTRVEHARNEAAWVMDRPARTVKLDAAGTVLAEIRHYYDGPEMEGLPLGQATRGLLSRQEEIVLTVAEAGAVYGTAPVDWAALGYHPATRVDGEPALAADSTRIGYDTLGRPVRRRDALGAETTLRYQDGSALVTELANALGHVLRAGYDPAWQLMEHRADARGEETSYRYDGLGRLTAVIRPGDTAALPTVEYVREDGRLPNGLVVRRRRCSGADEVYEQAEYFDGFGRTLQVRTLMEEGTVRVSGPVALNSRGEPVTKGLPVFRAGLDYEPPPVLPAGLLYRYEHDAVGRIVRAVDLNGRELRASCTPWAARTENAPGTGPAHPGTTRVEHFDALGRLAGVTQMDEHGAAHRASYRYDLLGRLAGATDLEGRQALLSASYDGTGRRIRLIHAAAGGRTLLYDATGRLVRWRDESGHVVERRWDALGRLAEERVDGTTAETYHWDGAAGAGLLEGVDDAAGHVAFGYDPLGRVAGKVRHIGGVACRLGYEHDPAGLLAALTYPDGVRITFGRWGDGRVRSVSGLVDEASYDAKAHLVGMAHHNGVVESIAYDEPGLPVEMSVTGPNGTLRHAQLEHDGLSRLSRLVEDVGPVPGTEEYDYDGLGHLVAWRRSPPGGPAAEGLYELDADGNLLRADEMAATAYHYDFGAPGALRDVHRDDGTVEDAEFDPAGHLTRLGGTSYGYDGRGRLERAEQPDGTVVTMVYDYRGHRCLKRVAGPRGSYEVRFVDDLYEDRAGVATSYTWLGGRLVAQRRGGGTRHLHTDHRFSVVLATRADGTADRRAWFGPYGTAQPVPDPGPGEEVSRQLAGCVRDPETGLYYFNHRFYSPALGRFLTPDPMVLAQPERGLEQPERLNLYAYTRGDPVDYIDPMGLDFWSSLGDVLGAIVVVAATIAAAAIAIVAVGVALASGGATLVLGGAVLGGLIGGIQGGSEGALEGVLVGLTAGVNAAIVGPLGLVTFLGAFPGIRDKNPYKGIAGWTSWLMPASWPGHALGLGVFLANGICHLSGSTDKIQNVAFDSDHGQILTAGGEYGASPYPWLGGSYSAHSVGGFSFYSNATWEGTGKTWAGAAYYVEHETGHMLSNAVFGFLQGIINPIQYATGSHDDAFFEKIAESNTSNPRPSYGITDPFWR